MDKKKMQKIIDEMGKNKFYLESFCIIRRDIYVDRKFIGIGSFKR